MPPLVGGQAATRKAGGNLSVTSLAANLGGLALQHQAGAGQAVSVATRIQTQEQIQVMAQAASTQPPVVMAP